MPNPEGLLIMAQFAADEGVDVSRHNGLIDWERTRRMCRWLSFGMVRLGEWRPDGNEELQPYYGLADEAADRNIFGLRRAGIVPGGYLRTNPTMNSSEKEAVEFVTRVHGFGVDKPGNMIPCVDMEDGTQQWGPWLREFITVYRELSPLYRLRIYSSGSKFNDLYGGVVDLTDMGGIQLVVADWSAPAGKPRFNPPIAVIHQYSNGSTVPPVVYHPDGSLVQVDRQRVITGHRLVEAMI
jgi:hypothetical protein